MLRRRRLCGTRCVPVARWLASSVPGRLSAVLPAARPASLPFGHHLITNDHDDAGVAIATALAQNARASRLHVLCLDDNKLGDGAACALGAALAAQGGSGRMDEGGLRVLTLSKNLNIGEPGAVGLAMGISVAGGWLQKIDLVPTSIDEAGRAELYEAAATWGRRWLPAAAAAAHNGVESSGDGEEEQEAGGGAETAMMQQALAAFRISGGEASPGGGAAAAAGGGARGGD